MGKGNYSMNTIVPQIPENAPFSQEQRAWLNGFMAGLVSMQNGDSLHSTPGLGLETAPTSDLRSETDTGNSVKNGDNRDAPWSDPSLPLEDRMKRVEGRPLKDRMTAAMGQLDCGQCGYNCEAYAQALFTGREQAVNLCIPGGKETQRTLKKLLADGGRKNETPAVTLGSSTRNTPVKSADGIGYSRRHPVTALFLEAIPLNKPGSNKDIRHVVIQLPGNGLKYDVGDCLGIVPENCGDLVDQVMGALHCDPEMKIGNGHKKSFRSILSRGVSLGSPTDGLFNRMAQLSRDPDQRYLLEAMANGEEPNGDFESMDVLTVLERFPNIQMSPEDFVEVLEPMQPRLYSISSSQKMAPDEVHLTVGVVRYEINGRERKGVASTFLSERLQPNSSVEVFIHKESNFFLPENDDTPIILVGPGTGVAPFRAFLQERQARRAKGGAWLFFGDQRRNFDFIYEEEWDAFVESGILTHLTTAFSRDQDQKVYVQHKMREQGETVWSWIRRGAYFYVCGDGKQMAGDVDRAFTQIVKTHGNMDDASAVDYVRAMLRDGRYQRHVY